MSETERTSTFRQPFLALMASLAAFMAIFGVRVPEAATTKQASDATAESTAPASDAIKAQVEPSYVPLREWDDPIEELELLLANQQKLSSSRESSLREIQKGKDIASLQKLLGKELFPQKREERSGTGDSECEPPPNLLILLQIVAGPSHANARESRTLWSHAFRMALSDAGFNRSNEQLIASLECELTTDHRVLPPTKGQVVLPMKLYERTSSPTADDGKSTGEKIPARSCAPRDFILNVWLMDDYFGANPWACINSVFSAVTKALPSSDNPDDLHARTKVAIVGPGGSDLLRSMDPTTNQGDGVFDPRRLSTDPLYWVNAHCTVPLKNLWKHAEIDKLARIQYLPSTPDDSVLIDLLAQELDQRLGSLMPVSKWSSNRILVFHEDDSKFGKNLIDSLKVRLSASAASSSTYSIAAFPYLRGIGLKRESPASGKGNSKLTDVSDYFRRTIGLYHENSDQGSFYGNQPIAIGILGGENEDKIALLKQIRFRYPQSLVFTNDLSVQYLEPEFIPYTRNLLIAAHAGLNSTLNRQYEKRIAFRDESQTTLWNGYQRLFQVALEKDKPRGHLADLEVSSRPTAKEAQAYIFEVGNTQFMEIQQSSTRPPSTANQIAGLRNFLAGILGCFTIWTLFTFPMLHAWWPAHVRFGRRLLSWFDQNCLLPFASSIARLLGLPLDPLLKTRDQFIASAKNAAVVIAVVSVIAVCLLPLSASECLWVSDSTSGSGWLWSWRSAILNRTMTWLTGVSVVPSVILLALCLPLTFWPAIKKEIERAYGLETEPHSTPTGELGKSMDQRIASIRCQTQSIQNSLAPSAADAPPVPSINPVPIDPCDSRSIRLRVPIALAYLVVGALLSLLFAHDDPWMIQMTLLAVVTSLASSCPTVRLATFVSFLVGVLITLFGWVFNDIPYVPARDPWIRAIASCTFAVAYWWLLIGLVKLFIHQRNLRKLLRTGTRTIDRICDQRLDWDRRAESEARLKLADDVMSETQSVSRIISRDLSQLTFVGLIVCFARMPWFDAWGMSLATWLTIVLPMAAPFVSSIFLRRRGFEFRDACLRYQSELAFHASTHGSNTESPLDAKTAEAEKKGLEEFGKRLSGWQARFKSYDRGLFSPLDKDPMISTGLSLLLAFFSGPQGDLFKRIASFLLI